ncbi:MAG: N-acetylmuramoyl-L-alanine amidase [Planctomycetes bacterium]|nr:N-acetylmuramoyl-L-alanine amidase [Planctomycetota bacterium]
MRLADRPHWGLAGVVVDRWDIPRRAVRSALLALCSLVFACGTNETRDPEPLAQRTVGPPPGWTSLESLAKTHGLRHRAEGTTGKHYLEGSGLKVQIDSGSRVAYFGEELVILDRTPVAQDGDVWIPQAAAERITTSLRPATTTRPVATTRRPPRARGLAGRTFVIDAGHGGKDPGTSGPGAVEKGIVLDISKRVASGLEDLGARVLMTRNDDRFVDLDRRVEISNAARPEAFISIHANAAANPQARGIEIFRPHQRDAGHDRDKVERSLALCEALYRRLEAVSPGSDRGIKLNQRNLRVLRYTHQPAALIELGFLTHPQDRALLLDAEYRRRLADAIVLGLKDWDASEG